MTLHGLIVDPVVLSVTFYFGQPKSHYGTGRNAGKLKASAPIHHANQPDLSKAMRAVEDAMSDIVYRDDRQICRYGTVEKLWTDAQERAVITVSEMGVPTRPQYPGLDHPDDCECEACGSYFVKGGDDG